MTKPKAKKRLSCGCGPYHLKAVLREGEVKGLLRAARKSDKFIDGFAYRVGAWCRSEAKRLRGAK